MVELTFRAGWRSFRIAMLAGAVLTSVLNVTVASAAAPTNCQFVLGFKTLHNLVPGDAGDCVTNQVFAANGDAQQTTTRGLMAWRKTDNWTAFTDGYRTWVNGPAGVQQRLNTERFPWEAPTSSTMAATSAAIGHAAVTTPSWPEQLSPMAAQFLDLLNGDRQSNGLQPLNPNPQLASLAQARAQQILTIGSGLNHYDTDGHLILREMVDDNHIAFQTAGENLAENNYDGAQNGAGS